MMDVFSQAAHALGMLLSSLQGGLADVAMKFFPFFLLLELPLFVLVCVGMIRFGLRRRSVRLCLPRSCLAWRCILRYGCSMENRFR